MCDEQRWKKFLEWAKTKERCYFLGIGDYEDFLSGSERLVLNNANFHDSTKETIEEWQDRLVERFYKETSFMKGRLIGLIEGNHFATYNDGTTTTQRLCRLMEAKYLGTLGFIRLILQHENEESRLIDVYIMAHHGVGGGSTAGNSINQVKKLKEICPYADIFIMGHDHRKNVDKDSPLRPYVGDNKVYLRNTTKLYIRSGSFLLGYLDGHKSYVVSKALPPNDLGVVKIEITPLCTRLHGENRRFREVDFHASI